MGVGSTLGTDDFLVAFGAGYGFARDGWFRKKTKEAQLPHILDLLLNSSLFIYLGTIIPWGAFRGTGAFEELMSLVIINGPIRHYPRNHDWSPCWLHHPDLTTPPYTYSARSLPLDP